MHVSKPDVTALSAEGVRYEPDENGLFEVSAELGEWLIRVHGWEFAAPAEVEPEPQPTNADGSLIPTPDEPQNSDGDGTDPAAEVPGDDGQVDAAEEPADEDAPKKRGKKADA